MQLFNFVKRKTYNIFSKLFLKYYFWKINHPPINKIGIVAYDFKRHTATLGDFINLIMLLRFLSHKYQGFKFHFFTYDENPFLNNMGDQVKNNAVENYKKLIHLYLGKNIQVLSLKVPSSTKKISLDLQANEQLVFPSKRALNKRNRFLPFIINWSHYYNFTEEDINRTIHVSDSNPTILSNSPLAKLGENNLIAWHIRYNTRYRSEANLSSEEVRMILENLKSKYPNNPILVLTDEEGENYLKSILDGKHLEGLLFQRDLGVEFTDIPFLLKKCKFYLQIKGGGVSSFAFYSQTPMLMILSLIHEKFYSAEKMFPWTTHQQKIIDISGDRDLSTYELEKILVENFI